MTSPSQPTLLQRSSGSRSLAAALASLPALAAAVAALVGAGELALALVVVSVALQLGGAWRGVVVNLPAAVLVVMTGLVTVAQLCAIPSWPLLGSPNAARGVLVMAAVALAVLSWLRRPVGERDRWSAAARQPGSPSWQGFSWLPVIPGALMAACGVAALLLPLPRQVGWFLGGDNVRHLWLVAEEASRGYLDYSVQTSPRSWHTVVVTAWRASNGELDGAGLVSLVTTMATSLWFGYAVLVLTLGLTAQRVARRLAVPARGAAVTGLVVGCATCWPTFMGNYLVLGFETAIICAVILATAFLELVSHPGRGRSVILTAAACAMVAHTWQLLLPAAGCAFLGASWAYLRPARTVARWRLVAATAVVALLVSWPSLRALFVDVGFARASIQGVPAPPMGLWLPLSLVGAALALVVTRDLPVRVLAVASVGSAVLAVLVAWRAGVPLTHYYPRKMLWQATLLGLPPTAAVGALGLHRLAVRRPGPRPEAEGAGRFHGVLRPLGASMVVVFVALSSVFPILATAGSWNHVDGSAVLRAASSPDAATARVVWVGQGMDSTIARILLDFYRVSTPQDRTIQYPATVADECALLAGATSPVVLSDATPDEVSRRYACAPGVRTLPIRPDLP